MIRRNVVLSLLFVIMATVLGQAGKSRFTDRGLCDVHTLDDLRKYSFSFVSVDDEEKNISGPAGNAAIFLSYPPREVMRWDGSEAYRRWKFRR